MSAPPPPGSPSSGRSDKDLQLLRARFHASQFRFTSALAAESGKASDGAFRIKETEVLKPTKAPPKSIYETIDDIEEEGCQYVEILEPEYDMFGDSTEDDGPLEEWDPDFIVKTLKKANQRWRDAVMEEDPLTDKQDLEAIKMRKAKAMKKKEKKAKSAKNGAPSSDKESPPVSVSLSQDSLHAPAMSPGAVPTDEPLIPAVHLNPGIPEVCIAPSQTQLQGHEENTKTAKTGADPLFDCLENDLVLDDQHLSEIAHGLKEGIYYDNAYLSDDLKKKLLEIDANKEKVEAQLVERALATPMKTDETANKIVEALTDKEVIFKTVDVEDTKLLTEYFNGSRKADDEVIAALGRVIDKILDRAPEIYPNKEELAQFLRNRGTAKSHLLDAMLSRKGGWLQNFYGSAYSAALAVFNGVEAVGKGLVAAKDVAEQGATMVRDYAGTTADVVNRSYTSINELAGQTSSVAREVASKGSEMASKVSDAASYGTEQALRVASVTAMFAGKVSSVVSNASSSLANSTSSTSVSTEPANSAASASTTDTAVTSTSAGSILGTLPAHSTMSTTTTTTMDNPSVASIDETKPVDEGEKAPKRNVLADSPAPLTFNGFLPDPASLPSPSPASTDDGFLATAWKSLTNVLMAFYGGHPESRENGEAPPKDDGKKEKFIQKSFKKQ